MTPETGKEIADVLDSMLAGINMISDNLSKGEIYETVNDLFSDMDKVM